MKIFILREIIWYLKIKKLIREKLSRSFCFN